MVSTSFVSVRDYRFREICAQEKPQNVAEHDGMADLRACTSKNQRFASVSALSAPRSCETKRERERVSIFSAVRPAPPAHLSGQDVVILSAIRTHAGMLVQLMLGFRRRRCKLGSSRSPIWCVA